MDEKKLPLSDITNVVGVQKTSCRKRLIDGTQKVYSYERKPRRSLDFVFCDNSKKLEFDNKLETVKKLYQTKSNTELLIKLMDLAIQDTVEHTKTKSDDRFLQTDIHEHLPATDCETKYQSTLPSYDSNEMFVCTVSQIKELLDLSRNHGQLTISSVEKLGHVCRFSFVSHGLCPSYVFWSSSPNMQGDFYVNYKMFHAYSTSGILQVQYERFCDFSGIGVINKRLLSNMASTYACAVKVFTETSINDSLKLEKDKLSDTNDSTLNGMSNQIDIMTDARHACRKNSYHSDVTALGQLTHRVVCYQHVTKELERSSQKHELVGTKLIYNELENKGISVRIHSHDRNSSVSAFVDREHPEVKDSYDTWHAAKEVRKAISKVAKGTKKTLGTVWHPELADKAAGVKTHTYWAMKHCEGSIERFKHSLDNIVQHYCDNHQNCHLSSRCKTTPNYTCSRTIIRDPVAANLLTKAIRGLYMYKHPEKYIYCRNTHYIESYHNTLLLYLDKRIHYGTPTYEMRVRLGILDWNEHVDRPASSERVFRRARCVNNRTPERVLKPKTYNFVTNLWEIFVQFLEQGIRGENDLEILNETVESDESENEESASDDEI